MGNYSKYTSDQLQEMIESKNTYQIYLEPIIKNNADSQKTYIDAYVCDNSEYNDFLYACY